MSLYKRSVSNWFNDRSLYMKRKRLIHQDTSRDVSELYTGRIGEQSNGGYVAALLAEQPEELKLALNLIVNNPEVLTKTPKGLKRENLNRRLERVLGIDFDFTGTMRRIFS